jgi:hypothetical protein
MLFLFFSNFFFLLLNSFLIFSNEESFVALCLVLFLFLAFLFTRNFLNFTFFYRTEQFYFSLIYLIKLNSILNENLDFLVDFIVIKYYNFLLLNKYNFSLNILEVVNFIKGRLFLLYQLLNLYFTDFFFFSSFLNNDFSLLEVEDNFEQDFDFFGIFSDCFLAE